MSTKPTEEKTFEEEMDDLEAIVNQLEEGDVPLEEAMTLFQTGMKLSKSCHDKLQAVEERIDQLIDEEGKVTPFNIQEEE